MSFFKEESKAVRLFEADAENELPPDLPYTPLPQSLVTSDNLFLTELNHTFSFSDVTCLACLCLVPVFGISGLVLGFALPFYFADYMQENFSNDQIIMASMLPPLLGLFLCMVLGFLVWGQSIEWASNWETGVAQRRGPGLAPACQAFFLSNPCLAQIKEQVKLLIESNQSIDTTDLENRFTVV